MKHYFFDGNTRLWGRKKKWQVVKKPLAEKKKIIPKKVHRKKTWFYTQVSVCFKQAKKDNIKYSSRSPLTSQVAKSDQPSAFLGKQCPWWEFCSTWVRWQPSILAAQQSYRGGGGATFPKHDWLMSDVECKLIYSSLLCLERERKRQSEDWDQDRQKEIIAYAMAMALGVIKLSSLVWLHLQLIAAKYPPNLTRAG